MSDSVLCNVENQIAKIQLNRPEVLNALDPSMAASLYGVITEVAKNKDVRCVQLTGAGSAFMAGGDLSYFKRSLPQLSQGDTSDLEAIFGHIHGIAKTLRSMPQPVVARVHGAVAGFGMSLMMACDLVMAGESTQFTLAYCKIGASPDGSATYALPRTMGTKRAMELALLGDRFDSTQAMKFGLINWIAADHELESKCDALLDKLVHGPGLAYAHTKRLINSSLDSNLDGQLENERMSFFDCATSDDFKEGITAFLDKRKPNFSG
ncbi:MAG: enoyl-CoA hydratase-related protein [Arenicellales bacterium]|nr:enoyl-CoA hydratase-related protein [Arenicellales bacterium]